MKTHLPKNTEVRCLRSHLIAHTNRDLLAGMRLSVNDLHFEPGQGAIPGEPTKCKICGSEYLLNNTIFDGKNFWPFDPKLPP